MFAPFNFVFCFTLQKNVKQTAHENEGFAIVWRPVDGISP